MGCRDSKLLFERRSRSLNGINRGTRRRGSSGTSQSVQSDRTRSASICTFNTTRENQLPVHFDDLRCAQLLKEAIHSREEMQIIRLFYYYTPADLNRLAARFRTLYSIDIVPLCYQLLSENVSDFVRYRLESRLTSICRKLNVVLREKPEGYLLDVLQIVVGYWELDLQELKSSYQTIYKAPLKEHIKQNTSVKDESVVAILSSILDEGTHSDNTPTAGCIKRLMEESDHNNLFENERYFFQLLHRKTREQLKDIFEGYLQTYQSDITVEIHRYYCSDQRLRDHLDAIVQLLRHGQMYFCNTISRYLNLPEEDQTKYPRLLFAILSRTNVVNTNAACVQYALKEIKNDYRKYCAASLVDDIKERVDDAAMRAVLIKHLSTIE